MQLEEGDRTTCGRLGERRPQVGVLTDEVRENCGR